MITADMINSTTQRFKRLYTITSELCVIDPQMNYTTVVQQKTGRWEVLIDIWKQNTRRVGKDVFLNVLFHIFTGEYLTHKKEKTVALFREIESALINDDVIFYAWLKNESFQKTLRYTINEVYSPRWFKTFQTKQGIARLFGHRDEDKLVSLLDHRIYVFLSVTYIGLGKQKYDSTKKEIIGILPEATGWSEEQWPKVSFVCTSIAQKYGLNAEKLRKYLDDVHDLICLSKNQDHHFRIDNIVDAELNYEFMKAIFKNNVDSAIWFLLSDLIPSIKGEWVKASNVSGSWLHEIIKAWADDKAHPYHHQARRLLFDMSMIYHV